MKYLFLLSMVLIPALANAQMVNPVLVGPTVNKGLVNGNGMQLCAIAGCTTAATIGSCCSNTITCTIPFNDTTYYPICYCPNGGSGSPVVIDAAPLSTTTITTNTCNLGSIPATCNQIVCLAIHQ